MTKPDPKLMSIDELDQSITETARELAEMQKLFATHKVPELNAVSHLDAIDVLTQELNDLQEERAARKA